MIENFVTITINGRKATVTRPTTYEQIVEVAGLTGNPSMIVSFKSGAKSLVPYKGQTIELDETAYVTVVHTNSA